MKRCSSTFLFITAIIFSFCLNATAQETVQNNPPSSVETSQTDCKNCEANLGTAPSMGSAGNYAVLGASTVTSTGLTDLIGNLGLSPGTSITGFPPGTVNGTINAGNAAADQAQADSLAAYNDLLTQVCDFDLTGFDLGGLTLTPGVYCFDTSAQLTGILTLDGEGNPNAVFVFKMGTTFITAAGSSVVRINAATACNLFYQVGSSATVGTATELQGTMIAFTDITLNTSANLLGRAIALNGAVTLDTNSVTRCNIGPSAASVNLGGRITTAQGHGIPLAEITMTDGAGNVRRAYTAPFGYYNFENVPVGQTVIVTVNHKRYTFSEPTRAFSLFDDIINADFVAN